MSCLILCILLHVRSGNGCGYFLEDVNYVVYQGAASEPALASQFCEPEILQHRPLRRSGAARAGR